jgi:hypothetical protein
MHIELFGEFLLIDARGAGEDSQNTRIGRRQLQWRQGLGEFSRSATTYLGQEKGDWHIPDFLFIELRASISQANHYIT